MKTDVVWLAFRSTGVAIFKRQVVVAIQVYFELVMTMPKANTRIMYIEDKSADLDGPATIGRVTFSKSGRSIYYRGRTFQSLDGRGYKANYFDVETGDHFWISGPKKDGSDRLYSGSPFSLEVDPEVATEYWRDIRGHDNT